MLEKDSKKREENHRTAVRSRQFLVGTVTWRCGYTLDILMQFSQGFLSHGDFRYTGFMCILYIS
jgi:hypothetical protein